MERVRFAPSPTGPLHIGGVRTALFNYLYTKSLQGIFILRVEDTDQERYVDGAESYIIDSLQWMGLTIDEGPIKGGDFGPYRQSERKALYHEYIKKLIANGKAYYAFDSKDELDNLRKQAEAKGSSFKYSKENRAQLCNSLSLSEAETKEYLQKVPYVVRLKNDAIGDVMVSDLLRGTIKINAGEIDDKILLKADGMPTYHFANVVDDHLMKISTVIRGEEWLPSLPLHQLIYDAFGWETPKFIHLPLILKPEGKGKLSKRDGDKGGFPVFPLQWNENTGFKEKGFLPEGMVNYLALLGWNDGTDKEIFGLKDLVEIFGLSGIQKGGARFDYDKAVWVNGQHLQNLSSEELVTLLQLDNDTTLHKRIDQIKERANTLIDLKEMLRWYDTDPVEYDEKVLQKISSASVQKLLTTLYEYVHTHKTLEKENFKELLDTFEIKMGVGMQSLRLALFGALVGPDLFEFMLLVDNDVILRRIERLKEIIKT